MNNTQYTWNFSDLYQSDDDPQIQKDIESTEKKVDAFIKKWKFRKDYLKDPKILYETFIDLENITPTDVYLMKPYIYIYLRKQQDETSSKLKAMYSMVYDKEIEITNQMQFLGHNIVKKIPKNLQSKFLNEPLLKDYKHGLETAFQNAKYLLSEKEEKIFNVLSKTSYGNWSKMISEFVSKSSVKKNGKELAFEEVLKLIQDTDKKTRYWAGEKVGEMLEKISDAAEYELNSILQTHNTGSEMHKHKSYDESRHISDDIDTKTVHAMLDTVTANFSTSHRYMNLFAKVLKQKKLKYSERAVEVKTKDNREYSYEESIDIVKKTFGELDPEFESIITNLDKEGRYDVYPKKGKSGGAFCFSVDKAVPIYVLLNHMNKSHDVLTLAHESGHAIHGYLSQKHQHSANSGHSLATAEVASTFFEDFVLEEMNKDADKEQYFYILQKKLSDDISTIFRQVACYNFELELHNEVKKKSFLSKDEIGEIFKKNMSAYLGDTVEFDESHKLWWVYWSHIRNPFYVYSYASGLLISKALQKNVKEDPKYISKVKGFLSAGSSKSTKDIFLDLGIDITKKSFWENGIAQINTMLDEWEALGKELGKF